jgi:formate/nitrite transporter FocA (FNT family)
LRRKPGTRPGQRGDRRRASIGKTGADYPALTWSNFLLGNLLPVTIGNIIGGSVMVAAIYRFVYLRKKPE